MHPVNSFAELITQSVPLKRLYETARFAALILIHFCAHNHYRNEWKWHQFLCIWIFFLLIIVLLPLASGKTARNFGSVYDFISLFSSFFVHFFLQLLLLSVAADFLSHKHLPYCHAILQVVQTKSLRERNKISENGICQPRRTLSRMVVA